MSILKRFVFACLFISSWWSGALALDANGEWSAVQELGIEEISCLQGWEEIDGISAAEEGPCRRVGFELDLGDSGMYALELNLTNLSNRVSTYSLGIRVGDARFAAEPVTLGACFGGVCHIELPWLPEGCIDAIVDWIEDIPEDRVLGMVSLVVLRNSGENAVQDWLATERAAMDSDGDGLSDAAECQNGTNPCKRDTDGDGLADGDESRTFRLSPLSPESNENVSDAEIVDERCGSDYAALTMTHNTIEFHTEGRSLLWPSVINSSASYRFVTEHAGFHLLELGVRNQQYDLPENYKFRFETLVNELNCGSVTVLGADCCRAGYGYCITPWLEPGTYTFRIRWSNAATAGARMARPALETVRLLWVNGTDANGDGFQDWMWSLAGNMPIDRDGDGIPDGREIRLYGTNPLLADTDGDGLSDAQEIARGTSPVNADTDGDGLTDGEEVLGTGTDPLDPGFSANWIMVDSIPITDTVSRVGVWSRDEGGLSTIRRGSLTYLISPSVADRLFIRIDASHFLNDKSQLPALGAKSRIVAYFDDEVIGSASFEHTPGDEPSFVRIPLPFVPSGATAGIRIVWDSVRRGLGLSVHAVSIESPQGPDDDGDGIQDWALCRSLRDDAASVPQISFFSPICLEGVAQYPSCVAVSTTGAVESVSLLSSSNWYVNIPLVRGLNQLGVSFENGIRAETHEVVWAAFDVASSPASFMARTGDTMLIRSSVPAQISLSLDGQPEDSFSISGAEIRELQLSNPGNWSIAVSLPDAIAPVEHNLTVVGGAFPSYEPAVMLGKTRRFQCPDVSPSATLLLDNESVLSNSSGVVPFTVTSMFKPHALVARAGIGGPIVDSVRIRPFWLRATAETFVYCEDRGEDYALWYDDILTSEVQPGVSVKCSVVLGGVTLDNYALSQVTQGASIPSASHLKVCMVRPDTQRTSICHTVVAIQNGEEFADAYRNNGSMPGDMK